jgi:hypothetical protein
MPDEIANNTPAAPVPASAASDQVGLRVSLIPAEEAERLDPRRGFRRFLTIVIVFIVAVGAVCGGLWFWVNANRQSVAKIDLQTADYVNQSKELEPSIKQAKYTQARLKALAAILPEHKTGLKILAFLEKYTLPAVGYTSAAINVDGSVNLAVSAASLEAYAAQINEFKSLPEIKTVVASGLSPVYDDKNNLTKVNFNFSLTFGPSMFMNQPADK